MNDFPVELVAIQTITFTARDLSPDEVEDIQTLKQDIAVDGLLHPLTVERLEKGYGLVAGLKRLIACLDVGLINIYAMILPAGLTDEEKRRISIRENLHRFNLPWWETVILEKELLEMRQAEHGVGRQGRKVGFSLRDLATELGKGLGTVSEDMRLAEAVMANPNLRKITDKITAKRLIFQEAKRIEAEVEAGLAPLMEMDTCYMGNSAEVLKHLPAGVFDVCVTDPPWLDFKIEHLRKDDQTLLVLKELYRVMKAEAFLYMFVSTPDFIIYTQELPKFGWNVLQMPLIWVKQNHVSHGLRAYDYARDYEPILMAVKGSPALTASGQLSSIFTYPLVHPSRSIHPNEKPIELIKHLLGHCTYEGSKVIEPFGGSGVTAHACKELKRPYVLIEREKQYFDKIQARLGK